MQQIKFQENFVSSLTYLPTVLEGVSTQQNYSTEKINLINKYLKAAEDSYLHRLYRDAINSYKKAQSEIYKILYPKHSVAAHLADDAFMLPISKQLEIKIAEASLRMAENIQPNATQPRMLVQVIPPNPPTNIALASSVGFFSSEFSLKDAQNKANDGIEKLNNGHIDLGIEIFTNALNQIGQPTALEEKATAGAISLNLSSAYIIAGKFQQAESTATKAMQYFASSKDAIGQAQATHNLAIIQEKTNRADVAKTTFKRATAILKNAQRLSTTSGAEITSATPASAATTTTRRLLRPTISSESIRTVIERTPATESLAVVRPISAMLPSLEIANLNFIETNDSTKIPVRWSGISNGWTAIKIQSPIETEQKKSWSLTVQSGESAKTIVWQNGRSPETSVLLNTIYEPRITATTAMQLVLKPIHVGTITTYLLHLYSFVIPQALGDCYSNSGDYERAEKYYLQAANYSYINPKLEAIPLWVRLANNYVKWGDSLYKQELMTPAKEVYARVINSDGTASIDSPLYHLAVFTTPANEAQQIILNISNLAGPQYNPSIALPILKAWARWQNLNANLDFFGLALYPIFTFEYLQQVASSFASQAIHAEREYVQFQVQAEAEAATRNDLESAVAMSEAEMNARNAQYYSAQETAKSMDASLALANQRVTDAINDKNHYAAAGYDQYIYQSIATAHSAGCDWYGNEIRKLAADMEAGSWHGKSGKLAAAATYLSGKASYEYQLSRLETTITQNQAMVPIAQAQANAAHGSEMAAKIAYDAAIQRHQFAEDSLNAFDNEVFTPQIWSNMAKMMLEISQSYQNWAIGIAKLMERAYNFENDTNLKIIKSEYAPGDTNGLLGGDFLQRDIDSFTYHRITTQRSKESQIKDKISIAAEFPFIFYEFLQTGSMKFETTLRDFDRIHPGFFSQRIQAVELEIIGLLPPEGVRGTVRAGNVSRYRLPNGNEKTRIHGIDTFAISEYIQRNDAFVFRMDPRMHGLFEGHGVATTWLIDLPRRSNNIDFRLITDVRLVLYYTAKFNNTLKDLISARQPLSGELVHQRDFLLRYDFPDTWYNILDTGEATFTITPNYLPRNENEFKMDKLTLRLMTSEGTSPANIPITITLPGKDPVTLNTDSNGIIQTLPGNLFQGIMGGNLLGEWRLKLDPPADSPLLDTDEKLSDDRIEQIVVITQYSFKWPE